MQENQNYIALVQGDTNPFYKELFFQQISSFLPSCCKSEEQAAEMILWIEKNLPMFSCQLLQTKKPYQVRCVLVCQHRPNVFKFFFEMISRWLVPGKLLNVLSFFAVDFRFPFLSKTFSDQVYTFVDLLLSVETEKELSLVKQQLPLVETEISLGVKSSYYARRILEVKGLAADEKTAVIQEYIAYLVERLPEVFKRDIFSEMQHVMVRCNDQFKAFRKARHMARIISVMYLFRKGFREQKIQQPEQRHLFVKLVRAQLHYKVGSKRVIGIFVGVNFLKRTEIFEKSHLLRAVTDCVVEAQFVENSFLSMSRMAEPFRILYIEIYKKDGTDFSQEQFVSLRRSLPVELQARVEQLMHPVFMPRNEEEIMRNILTLSGQLKYVRDLPQVIVNFEEQTSSQLVFTVICLRLLKEEKDSFQELLQQSNTKLSVRCDKCRTVGSVRKKYPKQAAVLQVFLPKEEFLRKDHSIDLYRARRFVVQEFTKIIGKFRDYNGGMISKQEEMLFCLKKELGNCLSGNEFLLENFFYSMNPVVMRSVLPLQVLKQFFLLFMSTYDEGKVAVYEPSIRFEEKEHHLFVLVQIEDLRDKETLDRSIAALSLERLDLATVTMPVRSGCIVGYVLSSTVSSVRKSFLDCISAHTERSMALS